MHQLAPQAAQKMKERSSAINKIHNNFHKKRMLEFSNYKNKLSKKRSYEKVFMNCFDQGQQTLDQRIQQRQKSLVKSNSIELPDIYTLVTKQSDNNLINLGFKNHVGSTFKTKRLYGLIKNLNQSQQRVKKQSKNKNAMANLNAGVNVVNPQQEKYDLKNSVNSQLAQQRRRLQYIPHSQTVSRYKQATKNNEKERFRNYNNSKLSNIILKNDLSASKFQISPKDSKAQYSSLDVSRNYQNQKLNIYNLTINNMNLHSLTRSGSGKCNTIQLFSESRNKNMLATHSKDFPVIFSPKSSMSNYYQPKYRSQHEEERRIKQQYISYIHRIDMETLHEQKLLNKKDQPLQGQQIQLKSQTRIQQLKKQAENMKKYIQVMKNNASLTFTMSLHDRRQNFEFQKRQAQKNYSIQHKEKKKRSKKMQLDLNEKLQCSPWGQDNSQHLNIQDFLKKM